MSKPKVVLVSCGTAIATSTVVAKAIEESMRERGIPVVTRQCKAAEIRSHLSGVDLIVTTTPLPDNLGVPVVKALPFLTGIGKEEVLNEIEEKLREA
ncbi:MAG: PTS sugar transporter subunit IIB [Chloroflexi bacterium]|nr:PTS sugar transporter subunit IIB [Chloroflexota bacterium]